MRAPRRHAIHTTVQGVHRCSRTWDVCFGSKGQRSQRSRQREPAPSSDPLPKPYRWLCRGANADDDERELVSRWVSPSDPPPGPWRCSPAAGLGDRYTGGTVQMVNLVDLSPACRDGPDGLGHDPGIAGDRLMGINVEPAGRCDRLDRRPAPHLTRPQAPWWPTSGHRRHSAARSSAGPG